MLEPVKLVQFQCEREGTLFYYQHQPRGAAAVVKCCPICGSKRVTPTGRTFRKLDETRAQTR